MGNKTPIDKRCDTRYVWLPIEWKMRCQTEAIKMKIIIIPIKCARRRSCALCAWFCIFFFFPFFFFVSSHLKSWISRVFFLRFSKRITTSHSLSVRTLFRTFAELLRTATMSKTQMKRRKTDSIDNCFLPTFFFFRFFSWNNTSSTVFSRFDIFAFAVANWIIFSFFFFSFVERRWSIWECSSAATVTITIWHGYTSHRIVCWRLLRGRTFIDESVCLVITGTARIPSHPSFHSFKSNVEKKTKKQNSIENGMCVDRWKYELPRINIRNIFL